MISDFISENFTGLLLLIFRLGLTLALYAFLAYAIRTIWRDLRQPTREASFSIIPAISLIPAGQESGTTYKLNEITVGRSPLCDLHIQDDTVSAKHARLYYRKNQWWIEDNQSSNGSYLNDIPVEIPTVVTAGDQLKLGSFLIMINFPD